MDTVVEDKPAADGSKHNAVEYDHKEASKPNPEVLGNNLFSLELGNDPAP